MVKSEKRAQLTSPLRFSLVFEGLSFLAAPGFMSEVQRPEHRAPLPGGGAEKRPRPPENGGRRPKIEWHYLSNAASCVLCVFCRANLHQNLLHHSPLLKKACVRRVVLDKWFPLTRVELRGGGGGLAASRAPGAAAGLPVGGCKQMYPLLFGVFGLRALGCLGFRV